ncbi:TonB-dependent receptor domain-containing protein [Thiomicrospira sp. ALE5]|uniref:TonB-dependent receptor domain-containing protein n=1 Tax=Thiomicrospira sp. ALE5 TaxID=748650 RepID=UPI0008F4068D|nr:TonB-dependent receptor [Thiomicrospira sp. ALE5]SFR56348.1 hemoglobin/transferrin/lactoferrin receptor protein [Thiomicrospira sp. ALE5]
MRFKLSPITAGLLMAGSFSNFVNAAESENVSQSLPQVSVVKDLTDSDAILERIERTQANELRDVFRGESDVTVGGGDRQGRRLHVRGVESSNLSVTVDGAQQGQNLHNHRGGAAGIDPVILKRVEIKPGFVAADDGPGALGGVVRFETVDAQDLLAPGQAIGAFVKAGYGSAAESKTFNTAVYAEPTDGFGVMVYYGGTDAENTRIGGGDKIPYSGYEDRNFLVKLSLFDWRDQTLRVGYEKNTSEGLSYQQRGDYPYHPGVWEGRNRMPPVDQTVARETITLNHRWNPVSDAIDLETNFYVNDTEWKAGGGNRFTSGIQGGKLANTWAFSALGFENKLTAGADYYDEVGGAFTNATSGWQRSNSKVIHYQNLGLFAQNRMTHDAWLLSYGLRVDDYSSRYIGKTVKGSETSLNASLSYAWTDEIRSYAGYGESARGYGNIPIHFARAVEEGADISAKAETARHYELGLRYDQRHSQFMGGAWHTDLTLFQTEIDDMILYRHKAGGGGMGGRQVDRIYNYDKTYEVQGYTLKAGWKSARLDSRLSYTHTDISNLPEQMHFAARTGAPTSDTLIWDNTFKVSNDLSLGYTLTSVEALNKVPDGRMKRPGYVLHDVQAKWEAARNLSFSFAVNNLLDEKYINHNTLEQDGFATEEPGRDFRVSVRYDF